MHKKHWLHLGLYNVSEFPHFSGMGPILNAKVKSWHIWNNLMTRAPLSISSVHLFHSKFPFLGGPEWLGGAGYGWGRIAVLFCVYGWESSDRFEVERKKFFAVLWCLTPSFPMSARNCSHQTGWASHHGSRRKSLFCQCTDIRQPRRLYLPCPLPRSPNYYPEGAHWTKSLSQ